MNSQPCSLIAGSVPDARQVTPRRAAVPLALNPDDRTTAAAPSGPAARTVRQRLDDAWHRYLRMPLTRLVDDVVLRRQTERLYLVFGGHIFFQVLRTAVQLDLFTLLERESAPDCRSKRISREHAASGGAALAAARRTTRRAPALPSPDDPPHPGRRTAHRFSWHLAPRLIEAHERPRRAHFIFPRQARIGWRERT